MCATVSCMKIKLWLSFLIVSIFMTGMSVCVACDDPPPDPPSPPGGGDCMTVSIYE